MSGLIVVVGRVSIRILCCEVVARSMVSGRVESSSRLIEWQFSRRFVTSLRLDLGAVLRFDC